MEKKEKFMVRFLRVVVKFLLFVLETVLLIGVLLYGAMFVIAKGPSPTLQKLFVTSVRETSAAGFLADLYFTPEEIAWIEAVNEKTPVAPTDTSLFIDENATNEDGTPVEKPDYGYEDEDGDGIIVVPVTGEGYQGYMMIVLDPTRVMVASSPESYGCCGYTVEQYVDMYGAVAGTNAGSFYDPNGQGDGSIPDSMIVYNGSVYYDWMGCYGGVAALDKDGILHVMDELQDYEVESLGIRSAVCFGPILISNGVQTDPDELPYSLNPRTAIGQRADKAILLLVIDGRQVSSIGASLQDEIDVMQRFGAINAINLDGGSSSVMWYQGGYINKLASVIGIRPVPSAILVMPEFDK